MAVSNPRAYRSQSTRAAAAPLPRFRYWLICAGLVGWTGLILLKLFSLQVIRHKEFVERAERQQQHTFEVAPRRGVLYDRNLHELAMTVLADSYYAVPSELSDKKSAVDTLAAIVHTSAEDNSTSEAEILKRVNASRGFAWIARRVSPEVSERVKALHMKGIYVQKEFERFYPDNEIAAQVLGYVGVDDNGLGGLEQKFNPALHGQPGRMYAALDARRRVLGSTVKAPDPGENLVLTIDENIQFIAERALDRVMARTHADSGTVVIQDVHTGQILALAIRPTFNPNEFRHTTPALLRDHAVSDVYEPGSTFKLVTYSAAMDQKVATPDDIIDCQGGQITLAGRVIHDDKSDHYGKIPVREALEHSSDVAAVKLALKVGSNPFYQYIRAFGFGSRSGLELPGETRGLLRPVPKWGSSSIGSIAIGQEIAVTPIQLVSMVSTIANGGVYLPPHIVMEAKPGQAEGGSIGLTAVPFHANEELPNPLPEGAHRAISTLAAAQMRGMMEDVVLYGTGKPAQLNGYSAGGKTGTAQKIDPATHRYSKTMHVASFAGIAPVNSPVIAVAVVMDDPHGDYYGTTVSAPVFADVAQQVLEYLGVPHDTEVHASRAGKPVFASKDVELDHEETGDETALAKALDELPADDPLRQAVDGSQTSGREPANQGTESAATMSASKGGEGSAGPVAGMVTPVSAPSMVTVKTEDAAQQARVPALVGMPVRQVVEMVAQAGLTLHLDGRGLARSQEPMAGSEVAPGSTVTVHCSR